MIKKALIIDSGLRNRGGHNLAYTRAVQAALEKRGVSVEVLANKNLTGELAEETHYRPYFSLGAFDFPPGNGPVRDLIYLYAQSVVYSYELEYAFKNLLDDDIDLIFCHTLVSEFELIGWSRFLSRSKIPGCLMILMRLTPGFSSTTKLKLFAHPYWRIKPHYLSTIHSRLHGRFVLLTDSEALSEDYARIFKHRLVTLPIPLSDRILHSSENGDSPSIGLLNRYGLIRDDSLTIGYMGDARAAKGFALLPDLVTRLLSERRANIKFVIQCPNSASGHDGGEPPVGVSAMRQLARDAGSRLTLIPERLSEDEYLQLFRYLDIVLIPYLDVRFVEGTSGVFTEAVALSKPVVVPSATWMARELSRYNGGVVFERGNIEDLAEKVCNVIDRYEDYAVRARKFSARWKTIHNADALADILLREASVGSGSPNDAAREI